MRNCCGLVAQESELPSHRLLKCAHSSRKNRLAGRPFSLRIPFHNVLWASVDEHELTIHYAYSVSPKVVQPRPLAFPIAKAGQHHVRAWTSLLLDRAYGTSQRKKSIKVLVNPFGGKGKAKQYFLQEIEPIFAASRCTLDVEYTRFSGHAVEIAEKLDLSTFDVVASCSGDGLPHEVFNGLGKRGDAIEALQQVAVVQLPCGSGNAMSMNLNGTASPSLAAVAVVKGKRTSLDLMSITQGEKRSVSFLSQSIGLVAEVDLGTDHLRWMGDVRFTYGFLIRLLEKTIYPCDIALKVVSADKAAIREHFRKHINSPKPLSRDFRRLSATSSTSGLPPLRFGTVNDPLPADWAVSSCPNLSTFYAGNMPFMTADANFFQAALPSDGCIDVLRIDADISRAESIKSLLAVEKGKLFDMGHVKYWKVEGFRITPRPRKSSTEGLISIDGEKVPFEPFQVEVHQALGTVLSRDGKMFETPPLA